MVPRRGLVNRKVCISALALTLALGASGPARGSPGKRSASAPGSIAASQAQQEKGKTAHALRARIYHGGSPMRCGLRRGGEGMWWALLTPVRSSTAPDNRGPRSPPPSPVASGIVQTSSPLTKGLATAHSNALLPGPMGALLASTRGPPLNSACAFFSCLRKVSFMMALMA